MLDWINQRVEEIQYACYLWVDNEKQGYKSTDQAKWIGRRLAEPNSVIRITSDAEGNDVLFEWDFEAGQWVAKQ